MRNSFSPVSCHTDELGIDRFGEIQDAFLNRDVVVDVKRIVCQIHFFDKVLHDAL